MKQILIYKINLFIFFVCILSQVNAQKQGNIWILWDSCRVDFSNSNSPNVLLHNLPYNEGGAEANANLANTAGVLQYYFRSDADYTSNFHNFKYGKLFNNSAELVENGDEIINDPSATNGALLLPASDDGRYTYLFTLGPLQNWFSTPPPPPYECNYALLYHKVDNYANNGKGKVIEKNKILYKVGFSYQNTNLIGTFGIEEKIASVRHANGRDWWIFIFDRKNCQFVRFLLNPTGVSAPQTQSVLPCVGDTTYWGAGEMVFSPQGNRLAYGYFGTYFAYSQLHTFNFDRCSGLLSNPKILSIPIINQIPLVVTYYGVAFSPDETKLYVTSWSDTRIHQFDFNAPDLNQSRIIIAQPPTNSNYVKQLENGPNGKIYVGISFNKYLSVIHSPDSAGLACNFELDGLWLNGKLGSGLLPNMPNYQLGALYPPPPIEAGKDTTICPGGTALLGTPAAPDLLYRWRPGDSVEDSTAAQTIAKPDVTTTYTLAVAYTSASACFVNFDAITVNIAHFPTAIIAEPDTFSGPPFAVHFKTTGADTSGLSFHWDFGDEQTGNGATTSHTYDAIDGYLVKLFLQDSSGNCKDTIAYNLKLTLITGVNAVQTKQNSFRLYPNPADESVSIEHNYENATVEIFTPLGKVVHTQNAPKPKTNIDLRRLAKGVYYVRLVTNLNQFLAIKKLIIH